MSDDELGVSEHRGPLATFYVYDKEELCLYSHTVKYYLTLVDFQDELRSKIKYGYDYTDIEDCLEKLQDFLFSLKIKYHLPED